jgi:hypothetical protein
MEVGVARTKVALIGALFLAACGGPPPGPPLAPMASTPSPAAVAPVPAVPAAPSAAAPAVTGSTPAAAVAVVVPAGALYACVVDTHGERQISAIELDPKVAKICAKDPEMGPCQYARDTCRRGGGRVFAPGGREITRATEAEYDRHVIRIRLQSN